VYNQSVSVPKKDTFCIVHCNSPYRDFVLDLGVDGTPEKYSEFVTCIVHEVKKLNDNNIQVNFSDSIRYNNSRDEKKPGTECTLTFESTNDQKVKGSVFKSGKNNTNTIQYKS